MLKQLYKWVIEIPESTTTEHRRTYYIALHMSLIGAVGHTGTLLMFAFFGVTPMVYVNIASVLWFIAVAVVVRRTGLAAMGLLLCSAELIIHQVLAVYYVGWGLGFQYYLFTIAGMVYLGHYRHKWAPLAAVALSAAGFYWLYLLAQFNANPPYIIQDPYSSIFFAYNLFSTFLGLGTVAWVYSRTAARMEANLEERHREILEAQQMIIRSEKMAAAGKLAAGLTHEINNPVGTVQSSAQTGRAAVNKLRELIVPEHDTGKATWILDTLEKTQDSSIEASQRLKVLMGRIKNLIQIDEAEIRNAKLNEIFEGAVDYMRSQLKDKRIRFEVDLDSSLPAIRCRPSGINHVAVNLLQNAVESIEGEGSVHISSRMQEDKMVIKVRDTGRGMRPEELDELFELKFSSSASRVKLGMGLPVSNQVVMRHGGEITVDSEAGKGSTFTVWLPVNHTRV